MDLQIQTSSEKPFRGEGVIKQDCLLIAGHTVYYRLYEQSSCFAIEICLDTERCRSHVGSSFARAAYLYELLVQGEVTPCTMQDILSDLTLA